MNCEGILQEQQKRWEMLNQEMNGRKYIDWIKQLSERREEIQSNISSEINLYSQNNLKVKTEKDESESFLAPTPRKLEYSQFQAHCMRCNKRKGNGGGKKKEITIIYF